MKRKRTALIGLLGTKDVDVLRSMLSVVYDAAIQAQFDEHIGAEPHERTESRRDLRNGSRTRGLNTRAGSLDLEIPRARNSNFIPTVIEHFKRSERALISAIQEAFIGGISTRKMEDILAKMGVENLSKSQISELCAELDARAEEFRSRALTEPYPYVWLDALYEKSLSVSGYRDVIGIDVVDTESKESWTGLLRGLRKRGLTGTKLVISDARFKLATMQGPFLSQYSRPRSTKSQARSRRWTQGLICAIIFPERSQKRWKFSTLVSRMRSRFSPFHSNTTVKYHRIIP